MDANYNLSGLINRVKVRLDDEEYSDDTITQFLNDTLFDALGEAHYQFLECIFKQYSDGPGILILPKNFQALIQVTAKTNHNVTPLKYMPAQDFLAMDKKSGVKNYHYTVFSGQILYNLPEIGDNEDDDYYEVTLYYLAKPLPISESTDIPVIPYEFGEILVMGALARAERLRDNFDYAAIYENKYDELVTNMKLRYCPRQLTGENRAKLPVAERLRH